MRTLKVNFPEQQALCVFPGERSELEQAIAELHLGGNFPVIVLIGGGIDKLQAKVTRQAIQTISRLAENTNALIISGGTDMGVMAEIGQLRSLNHYKFPLIGIAPEAVVTWPDGPQSTNFLLWGKKRWQLDPNHSHFILVPGKKFGDESPWIVDAATIISGEHRSMTILINGGEVSRKDIDLSLEKKRPVLALSRTGRLADELSRQPNRNKLITVAPANAERQITEIIHEVLSVPENSVAVS
jgi:hypothetical protein